jgi:hypothetical protein
MPESLSALTFAQVSAFAPEVCKTVGFAGSLYYSVTLLELFTNNIDEAAIRRIESDDYGSADRLAAARQAFATTAMLAWPRISSFRETWNMEVLDSPVRRSAPKTKQVRPRRHSGRPRPPAASRPGAPAYTGDGGDDETLLAG